MAPSRNQSCPCGSGNKYKKCCLAKDEAVAREASERTAANVAGLMPLPRPEDEDENGNDEWLDDPDVQEALDDLPPLFEIEDVTRVTYARAMVASLADFRRGQGVEVTSWAAPDIPRAVLDSFELEALDELPLNFGHPSAAEPIHAETIDVETRGDHLTFQIFNRAVLMFRENTAGTRRIHRVCETLRRAAAGQADALVVSKERPEPRSPRRGPGRGTCEFCGTEMTFRDAAAHVAECAPRHDATTGAAASKTIWQIEVTSPISAEYWLLVEARADAKVEALDAFLRDIWLECCGHLSVFATDEADYFSKGFDFADSMPMPGGPKRRPQRSMTARIGEVLPADGGYVTYEYDFGSTTPLRLQVVGSRAGRIGRAPVRLAARNAPPAWACAECGAPAAFVCALCIGSGAPEEAAACRRHARGRHACGEADTFLRISNSPRNGICGYSASE